ncbi:GAF domain-containing sensor histidine kinase [Paenibacillus terrigena]|uniref:GAF domain-containing sensor histidine kinase n=1 Tax=Paenibacillus terrigena TaxID=369333 RepID=UPI0028D099FC|nr:GAF domain-containing sensor histidine kinase [Paenibacillus terrigena]
MSKEFKVHELLVIKSIAETINQTNDLEILLNSVLRKLVELTDMHAGWIFLAEDCSDYYSCPADYQLPKALEADDRKLLTTGACWCLDGYWNGKLKAAVNTIYCQRLDQAVAYKYGDTEGITHHATIPLTAGNRRFGILNVASAGKEHFNQEELTLMESIAFQVGTAVERTLLYQSQQKRADLYSKLGELARDLGKLLITEQIPDLVTRWIGEQLGCDYAAFFMEENGGLSRRTSWQDGKVHHRRKLYTIKQAGEAGLAFLSGETQQWRRKPKEQHKDHAISKDIHTAIAVPLQFRDKPIGVIFAGSQCRNFDEVDVELLEALSGHITLAFENARLHQQQLDLLKWEERNRLARDLHDSVSQMLFSLQFTARGMEAMLENPPEMLKRAVKDMQDLTQSALTEMRSLILQLRPVGLEQGLLTGLYRYGKAQGLVVINCVEGMLDLSSRVEEALFRIGQEALNNTRKYAGHPQVQINLKQQQHLVCMEISDQGDGFSPLKIDGTSTLGMRTMRERAESLGGTLVVDSRKGEGTTIRVLIPNHK